MVLHHGLKIALHDPWDSGNIISFADSTQMQENRSANSDDDGTSASDDGRNDVEISMGSPNPEPSDDGKFHLLREKTLLIHAKNMNRPLNDLEQSIKILVVLLLCRTTMP